VQRHSQGNNINKKSILAAVAGVLIVAAAVGTAVVLKERRSAPAGPRVQAPAVETSSLTRAAAPEDAVVPEKGDTNTPSNVAVPTVAAASSRDEGATAKYRKFDVKVERGVFVPSTVIVNQDDTVRIDLLAVDADYDFTQPELGYSFPLLKGKLQPLAFTATGAGDFLFYCASCGGPAQGPTGHIIIVPKK
jgi:heme/copper-type cytochrome/quinol oxidase subunit 2